MIELVKKEHLPGCLAVIKKSYEKSAIDFDMTEENCPYRGRTRLPYSVFEDEFNNGYQMFGYILDKKVVGFLSFKIHEQEMKISDIAVLPEYQNKGIGSSLMQFAKEQAISSSCIKLLLGMVHDNIPLRNWYQRMGFETVKLTKYETVSYSIGKMELIL